MPRTVKATPASKLAVGTRVYLRGDHPWAGNMGTLVRHEKIHVLPWLGECPVVKLDNGHESFVTKPEEMQVMEKPAKRRPR